MLSYTVAQRFDRACVFGADGVKATSPDGDQGRAQAIWAVVRSTLTAFARAGWTGLSGAAEAVEGACRALARKVVTGATAHPHPVADHAALAAALAQRPSGSPLGGATGAALVSRVARKFGPLRFLARRTPTWLVVAVVPALHASVSRGAEELTLIASYLSHQAQRAGVRPDPERVRRAAVQLVLGVPVDPSHEPRHTSLAGAWLRRALRATMPFSDGVAIRNPDGVVAAAATVDPLTLGAPAPPERPAIG